MKYSLNWLKEHLDNLDISINKLTHILTDAGIEIENVSGIKRLSKKIVVAKVLSFEKHPNADRLRVCSLDAGLHGTLQIVCGANNFEENDLVALALVDAILPPLKNTTKGFKIKNSKIRGVESFGMICSEEELGLADKSSGILVLDKNISQDNNFELGIPFAELENTDAILEFEITPNRPDLLSHLGLSREISALLKLNIKGKKSHNSIESKVIESSPEEIQIEENSNCSFYSRRIIKDISICESTESIKQKITSLGLKPINNIVDVTNFVMLDMGNPIHAFDLDTIQGGIKIRKANKDEKFLALDDIEYTLTNDDIVITDDSKILALAGIIGGKCSSITENTKNILIESAYFNSSIIRKTASKLSINTDSSYRFERGVDPFQVLGASQYASDMILQMPENKDAKIEEAINSAGQLPNHQENIQLNLEKTVKLIGSEISIGEIDNILNSFNIIKVNPNNLEIDSNITHWKVPTYRIDLTRPIDLIEEITRVYGMENIPSQFYSKLTKRSSEDIKYSNILNIKKKLIYQGFYEVQSLKFISENDLDFAVFLSSFEKNNVVTLQKPLNADTQILSPSLIPRMIQIANKNYRNGSKSLALFEIAPTFLKFKNNYVQKDKLTILLTGKAYQESWIDKNKRNYNIYDIVGIIRMLINLKSNHNSFKIKPIKNFQNVLTCGEINFLNQKIGFLGKLNKKLTTKLDIKSDIILAEIDINKFNSLNVGEKMFDEINKFPSIFRDIAIEVPNDFQNQSIEQFFENNQKNFPILSNYHLFDVFEDPTGKKLAKDKKSLAYNLSYQSNDKTLTASEVDTAHKTICDNLVKNLSVNIR